MSNLPRRFGFGSTLRPGDCDVGKVQVVEKVQRNIRHWEKIKLWQWYVSLGEVLKEKKRKCLNKCTKEKLTASEHANNLISSGMGFEAPDCYVRGGIG